MKKHLNSFKMTNDPLPTLPATVPYQSQQARPPLRSCQSVRPVSLPSQPGQSVSQVSLVGLHTSQSCGFPLIGRSYFLVR